MERDNSATADLLATAGIYVFEEDIESWTDEQIKEAENWASAVYLSSSYVMNIPNKPKWLKSSI